MIPINDERLAHHFTELCTIESPSGKERKVADYLCNVFSDLRADSITFDDSSSKTGADCGNLLIRFAGNRSTSEPLFFCCHMDTVGPTEGVEVIRKDNIFTSGGDTILGADDKSGIAALIEMMSVIKEKDLSHCPIELLFTTSEEIGLLGAKAFDPALLQARMGYALDSSNPDSVIIGAPAANRLVLTIHGRAAHSGLCPECGINALTIAAKALGQLKMGWLDDQSTANIGIISGGTASNIVPERILLKGEVRSHSEKLLEMHTRHIVETFEQCAAQGKRETTASENLPRLDAQITLDFPAIALQEDEPVVSKLNEAAISIGKSLSYDIAGGGSDANIFTEYGLRVAILPTGMRDVHTTDEWVALKSMTELTELLIATVSL